MLLRATRAGSVRCTAIKGSRADGLRYSWSTVVDEVVGPVGGVHESRPDWTPITWTRFWSFMIFTDIYITEQSSFERKPITLHQLARHEFLQNAHYNPSSTLVEVFVRFPSKGASRHGLQRVLEDRWRINVAHSGFVFEVRCQPSSRPPPMTPGPINSKRWVPPPPLCFTSPQIYNEAFEELSRHSSWRLVGD